jgi:hypothetical protein
MKFEHHKTQGSKERVVAQIVACGSAVLALLVLSGLEQEPQVRAQAEIVRVPVSQSIGSKDLDILNALPGFDFGDPIEREADRLVATGEVIRTQRLGRLRQVHQGIEVLGAGIDLRERDQKLELHDRRVPVDLNTHARLEDATLRSLAHAHSGLATLGAPLFKILPSEDRASTRLVAVIEIEESQERGAYALWLDAQSGELVAQVPYEHSIAPVRVLSAERTPRSELTSDGSPLIVNLRSYITPRASDAQAKRALSNARKTLEYYERVHGRRSFDGKGSVLTAVVHMGRKFANAFWDSRNRLMAYGDGDGQSLGDMTRSLDVAGHEMTHGVISTSADLQYFGESGALNEAIADYFGVLIEGRDEWALGTEVLLDARMRETGVRNLASPESVQIEGLGRAYPAHRRDQLPVRGACTFMNDQCWVHINSTIPAHALYQLHQAVGQQSTEKLLFRVLTEELDQTSSFQDFRDLMVQACGDLLAASQCIQVDRAFSRVGL